MVPIRVLFICHGNICRSPMAEFVMKKMVKDLNVAEDFEIASAATSTEEIGNSVYPPVKKLLSQHHISCKGKTARQMTKQDYADNDLLIGMDRWNLRNMLKMTKGDPDGKCHLLLDYTSHPGDVADPWYTRDFDQTWEDVNAGCCGLLNRLLNENKGV